MQLASIASHNPTLVGFCKRCAVEGRNRHAGLNQNACNFSCSRHCSAVMMRTERGLPRVQDEPHVGYIPGAVQESEAWLLLLLELVPVVGAEQLLEQVLPLALSHGEVNEPVASRVVCCRLLGAMTPILVSSWA